MTTSKTKEAPKSKLKSFFGDSQNSKDTSINAGSMINAIRENMGVPRVEQPNNLDPLAKSVKPQIVNKDVQNRYDKSKIVFSSREWSQTSDNVWTKGWRRISDPEQREVATLDPYIAAIVATRVSQAASCGYRSESRFDKGCRVSDLNPPNKEDFQTEDEFKQACKRRSAQMDSIMKWVLRSGTHDQDIINSTFAGCDLDFKKCTLREMLEAQVRNLLTFGRCGSQIFRNEDGLPVMYRPVAIETFFNAVPGENVHIGQGRDTVDSSLADAEEYNKIEADEKPAAYVQRIDGQNVNFYTEDDLQILHWQKQALFNLNGYPMSPIESAVFMVFVHQQTLSYLRNQFVKGMAAKGILALESTSPAVELSDADLDNFRQQFHNYATRNDNSAVMPVLSGPVKANFIQLSPTPRDMEFLQVEEHVIRALCSAFQISPQEMGYGHLSLPQGGLTQSNKQEEIVKGEERGLRQLLDIVFDGINEILYENFPEAKDNFKVTYVGIGEDTRDAVVNRQTTELQTTATMDSMYADSEKQDMIPYGGKVPLSATFHENVVRYMKYGQFMSKFFGDEGAEKNPAYDFIIDPNLNQAYQQLLVQPIKEQRQQAEMQNSMIAQQMEGQQQQMDAQAQQGAQQQPGQQQQQPGQQQPQEAESPQPSAAPEQAQKSESMEKSDDESVPIRDMWLAAKGLKKSVDGLYFRSWLDAHKDKINKE